MADDDAVSASRTCSASTSYPEYAVFLNHRGPDLKATFATRLYHRLTFQYSLPVFLDSPELQPGQTIISQIEAAIRTASVQIAIFSRTYAESKWCMNELVLMVDSGAFILPIFYDVEPSELRWTGKDKDGAYAQALRVHEDKQRCDSHIIRKWRNAFSHVADISGFELKAYNGDEDKLLEAVVQSVLRRIKPNHPNGLLEKLEEVESKLLSKEEEEERLETKVVGIVGRRGVGTTMLVKILFERQREHYNRLSCLREVREKEVNDLQSQLIMDLIGIDVKIEKCEEGIVELQKNLKSCHAFILLDGVDHRHQLDALLPVKYVLHHNSVIFVTSPHWHVLTSAGIPKSSIYHLTGLSKRHSRQLFCSHSFLQPNPPPRFENLVNRFITACNRLPLPLKLFGALLCGEHDNFYWEELLNAFEQVHPNEIVQNTLRICYDSLKLEEQKIFLDIACFAIGKDRDSWVRIWDGSGWKGLEGFRSLERKCMVELDYRKNTIRMHNLVRDFGRNLASSDRSGPLRIWDPAMMSVLEQSSSEVRGIRMAHRSTLGPYTCENGSSGFRNLQLLEAEGDLVERILTSARNPSLIWLRWINCGSSSLPSCIPMQKLRVLEVTGSRLEKLWPHESQAPLLLRELRINAPLVEIPKSLMLLKHLERIVITSTCLETFPEEFNLPSLKYLKLQGCRFQRLWECESQGPVHLRELILDAPLIEFPKSLGQLKHLEMIVARNTRLATFPEEFNLPSLKYLELGGCQFQQLWQCGSQAPLQLRELKIHAPRLELLPESIGLLNHLEKITIMGATDLATLPEEFGNLRSLEYLSLGGCSNLQSLLDSIGNLPNLRYINLSGCTKLLETFPNSIRNLTKLLNSIGNFTCLQYINISCCKSLEMLPNSFGCLPYVKEINLYGCQNLKMLPDSLRNLRNLQRINLARCKNLKMSPDLFGNLSNLEYIDSYGCRSLKTLPNSLSNLTNDLQRVDLFGCKRLEMITDSSRNLKNFRPIDFCCCRSLTNRSVLVRKFEDAPGTFQRKFEKYRRHPSVWLRKIGAPRFHREIKKSRY